MEEGVKFCDGIIQNILLLFLKFKDRFDLFQIVYRA